MRTRGAAGLRETAQAGPPPFAMITSTSSCGWPELTSPSWSRPALGHAPYRETPQLPYPTPRPLNCVLVRGQVRSGDPAARGRGLRRERKKTEAQPWASEQEVGSYILVRGNSAVGGGGGGRPEGHRENQEFKSWGWRKSYKLYKESVFLYNNKEKQRLQERLYIQNTEILLHSQTGS